MPKGFFTQGLCVLLGQRVSLNDIEPALGRFEVVGRRDASRAWEFGGPTVTIDYRREVNGLVAVDLVDRTWPDHMGDAKTETTLFGAWGMGHFGPFAYPGCLQRAAQQCWSWPDASTVPRRHQAFIRIRSSYVFGAGADSPVMPADYDPVSELRFVTDVAAALLDVHGAFCYFNPNGEVLFDRDTVRERLNYAWSNELPPLDLWSNVRLFNIDPEWSLMDTVGNRQLDIPDMEACCHSASFDLNAVANFLRNASMYVLENGEIIKDGDTMDGPGDIRWQSRHFDDPICDPPRAVLRWLPLDGRRPPSKVTGNDRQ